MTLLDLANFICGKVNQTETEDVAACKGFLTRRHEMVWNAELWKDALLEYRQTIDPTATYTPDANYLPTKGVLLLPPIVQRVIAARTDTRVLNIQRPEYYYRIDYDAFAKTGTAAEYILLPPCVWELDDARNIYAVRGDSADAGISLVADLADSNGVDETRTTKPLDEDYKLLAESERVASATKLATSGGVELWATGEALTADHTSTNGVTDDVIYQVTDAYYEVVLGNATSFTWGFDSTTEDGVFLLNPQLGSFQVATGETLTGSLKRVYSCVTAAAADTNFKRRQRIRFIEIPTASTTLRVLGKRICPTFSADNDEPAINGMDNLLIAFGMADMLQRERQYGKATQLQQEALQLLAQLKQIEVAQQAHHQRIIPESGFGDDYFTGRVRGFSF